MTKILEHFKNLRKSEKVLRVLSQLQKINSIKIKRFLVFFDKG